LAHWLIILSVAWPMMTLQHGIMFYIAWNLWGNYSEKMSTTCNLYNWKQEKKTISRNERFLLT